MDLVPFVHQGLGNSSYLLGIDGRRAVAVDPDRSVARYLRAAEERGWRIDYVLETHLHADFVSGARELIAAAGARVFLAAAAGSRVPHEPVSPGGVALLDGVQVEVVGSPGHTPEHLSYVVRRVAGPPLLFSGGSLIVGGAARTDLIAPDLTDSLTRAQYHTVREAFAHLPDETVLLPTHGGGSFCSTGGGVDRSSTLGWERRTNPFFAFDDEEEFVAWFPTTFPATPDYYARMRVINRAGPRLRREVPLPRPLASDGFDAARRGALVVDLRERHAFARGHLPRSLSNALRDAFAVWLGWLVPDGTTLLFVAESEADVLAAVDEALLVGYESFAGWLEGGVAAWERSGRPLQSTRLATPEEARAALQDGAFAIDVREPDEYAGGHLPGALHLPLGDLYRRLDEIPPDRPVLAYCGVGDRASTAASLLERAGIGPILNLDGGFEAWVRAGFRVD
jgi:hydroxyacylglutathione hydrolase